MVTDTATDINIDSHTDSRTNTGTYTDMNTTAYTHLERPRQLTRPAARDMYDDMDRNTAKETDTNSDTETKTDINPYEHVHDYEHGHANFAPTISLGFHQNIGLHTGARANAVLLTYLLTNFDMDADTWHGHRHSHGCERGLRDWTAMDTDMEAVTSTDTDTVMDMSTDIDTDTAANTATENTDTDKYTDPNTDTITDTVRDTDTDMDTLRTRTRSRTRSWTRSRMRSRTRSRTRTRAHPRTRTRTRTLHCITLLLIVTEISLCVNWRCLMLVDIQISGVPSVKISIAITKKNIENGIPNANKINTNCTGQTKLVIKNNCFMESYPCRIFAAQTDTHM